ncbi:MAG: prepilin-type N-terminal cleavage/methylation domain-containing protein [Nitrospirae bacterium]|nr:prepilin-type N-terminal cleavage/methylation domain-containing protein [Nitrospirota bacterium]
MRLSHNTLRRCTNPGNSGGFTLIELMVATFVSVIILAAVSVLFMETQRQNSTEKARLTLIREAKQLLSVTGDGFYSSVAGNGFIYGLRGSGGCTTAPSPLPSPSPGTISSNGLVTSLASGTTHYYTLQAGAAPDYISNTASMTGYGYITAAAIYCDDYAVINGYDGTSHTTAYTRFNLSDPDTKARLGTDIVHEEIWALYTLNVGRRL